jgi:ketosteroid isomerase-like protein
MQWSVGALLLVLVPTAADAAWRTEVEAVRVAAAQPDFAAVLAAMNRLDAATETGDRDGFLALMADDVLVNSPYNTVADKTEAGRRFKTGLIDYSSFDRIVDCVARRRSGEIVAMGEEIIHPRGQALHAGKTVRRRFTDVWRNDGGSWKLALRQATIFDVK